MASALGVWTLQKEKGEGGLNPPSHLGGTPADGYPYTDRNPMDLLPAPTAASLFPRCIIPG